MQMDVIPSVNEARSDELAGKTVLVIDVLRATSNMVTGLVHGCTGIIPVETVAQAKALQSPAVLLGGERNCRKLAGFDLGNSPFEYMEQRIAGKLIGMTTTNGTRAVQKTQRAHKVIACSLLNVTACAEAAWTSGRDVYVLCSGTQDEFSQEDGLCAGMVVEELKRLMAGGVECNDFGLAMQANYIHHRHRLADALLECTNGKRLSRMGFEADVEFCSRVNQYKLVPVLQNGILAAGDSNTKR